MNNGVVWIAISRAAKGFGSRSRQELALSFGALSNSLSLSDIGNWMSMPLGGIGLSNHL
jgi:hypothetical protein